MINRASQTLILFSLLLVSIYTGSLLLQSGLPDPLGVVIVEGLILLCFVFVLIYVARKTTQEPFPPSSNRIMLVWTGSGILLADLLILVYLGFLALEDISLPLEETIDILVFGAAWGSASGALIALHWARARQNLNEAVDRRDEFAFLNSVLRHNVLNGINLIQGTAANLAQTADESETQQLKIIENRSKEIATLIDEIKDVTKLRASAFEPTSVDVADMLREAVDNANSTFPEAEFNTDLPENAYVRGSPLLRAAFDNLLTNAVEHNDAATPKVWIAVSERKETAIVDIADNGPGLPDDIEKLWTKEDYSDTFGLYLVKTVIEEIDGDIDAHPHEKYGTVFRCILKRDQASAPADTQREPLEADMR